jgi:hypothetical protein
MRKVPASVASLALLLAAASSAFAQIEQPDPPLPSRAVAATARVATAPDVVDRDFAERAAEAAQWIADYTDWKQWSAQWRNRREPGWFTGYRERKDAPVPPSWLADRCVWIFDDADPLMAACRLLREWNEDSTTTELRQVSAITSAQRENESKTTWWEHVHVDVLWPAMQLRSSMYGVIGIHTATSVGGRVQMFVAPGAMLLNIPARNGARAWKFAANYGIGFRLFEFVFPGTRRLALLHANAARAWVVSDVTDVATGRTIDFAGFSLTFKKTP